MIIVDAVNQGLFKTASFWADKLISITNDPLDVFNLAKIYYSDGEYSRCEHLLRKSESLYSESKWIKSLIARCCLNLEKFDDIISLLKKEFLLRETRDRKYDCIFLISLAFDIKLDRIYGTNLDILASLYCIKGKAYLQLDLPDKAKSSLMDAMKVDPRCYEAFDALVSSQLLSLEEETSMVDSLENNSGPQMELKLIKSIYTCRLTKVNTLSLFNF